MLLINKNRFYCCKKCYILAKKANYKGYCFLSNINEDYNYTNFTQVIEIQL